MNSVTRVWLVQWLAGQQDKGRTVVLRHRNGFLSNSRQTEFARASPWKYALSEVNCWTLALHALAMTAHCPPKSAPAPSPGRKLYWQHTTCSEARLWAAAAIAQPSAVSGSCPVHAGNGAPCLCSIHHHHPPPASSLLCLVPAACA